MVALEKSAMISTLRSSRDRLLGLFFLSVFSFFLVSARELRENDLDSRRLNPHNIVILGGNDDRVV